MARILILIGGHLCTAPRPQKEAAALAAAGHEVLVAGIWFDPKLCDRDRELMANQSWKFQPILDFRGLTIGQKLQRLGIRLQAKVARSLYQKFQMTLPALLGYGAPAMLRFAKTYWADLTIVHSEAGLWVGQQLQQQGYTVGVDFEDWFSEDLLPSAKAQRPIAWIQSLEASLARNCQYCLTPSQAMAQAMANAYQSPTPTAIYNAFSSLFPAAYKNLTARNSQISSSEQQAHDRQDFATPSLHWFSQTIGPGRGLETLLAALPKVQAPIQIHLRGNCPAVYRDWLMAQVPEGWHDRLFIHETVANSALPWRIAEHDIGLALETTTIPSRDLTVTNKLFQYLQAGLAVIATDTAGQREVLQAHPQAGQLIPSDDPIALAQAINTWAQQPEQLAIAKQAAIQAGRAIDWETQIPQLLHRVELALRPAHTQLPPTPSSILV
ncbi:glycosyltransferase [Alkalinema sp. FACHB-956]|uniref:glycosyltransferase n=1 Tax=Alkalinema sp. FACHB-956 TaxID=2692768 RepID=UPI001683711E|nr:glycosyltransferase [Alkalinema sp. FACHB-956]MBD2325346.1 glycosyltransferase [Alkalinema sp. FACHB-956]